MDIVLIAGLWLPSSIWDETAAHLARLGHRAVPVALPGQGDGAREATLSDQLEAVVRAIDAADEPLVVGHSAASTLAWLAADRRGADIRGAVLVGGFPTTAGERYAAFFALEDGAMPFPGWEPFAGPDSADLDQEQKDAIAHAAIPVPGGVAEATVEYRDPRRTDVPVWAVCPEYSPAEAQEWIDAGEVPELASATRRVLVDIDAGHWPMVSCPDRLAHVLSRIAEDAGTVTRLEDLQG
ncbi:alpha/beta hydrolase [Brachybacterium huguangmaarense]|uniref:Alpha/beta hydrolase n=1 Tax=Brachybacterium huguangmaarense TaxID=1652028 RepID=A0ABY6G2K6_9MICO|nr:alpha/beta hydrolase [Brachybacterium huguangmaarense]UYG16864.1 alpha/beta hydrolase [Brachybacterium huguangmaarense]